jgi:hypothetical protein
MGCFEHGPEVPRGNMNGEPDWDGAPRPMTGTEMIDNAIATARDAPLEDVSFMMTAARLWLQPTVAGALVDAVANVIPLDRTGTGTGTRCSAMLTNVGAPSWLSGVDRDPCATHQPPVSRWMTFQWIRVSSRQNATNLSTVTARCPPPTE